MISFKNIYPILSGIEIGVPLNIISKITTDVNFPNTIITKESILINFLLGFITYKQDRYLDAQEYFNNFYNISNPKHKYYISLLDNEKIVQLTLFCSYITICTLCIFSSYDIKIILPLFTSTFLYKYFKKNNNLSFFKPFYVAIMWTICTNVIPLTFDNHDYSLNFLSFAPTFFNIFSLTNLADLKDYDEDLKNNVNTLPIILGKNKINKIILLSSFISTFIFMNSEYYSNNFHNIFYICTNIFPLINLL
tara:strand:+ start:11574 stop:12323 length:750 start_codon:yes stop_codon:yes gene_type:complete